MDKIIFPLLGILFATSFLVIGNELFDWQWIRGYEMIFIITGLFFGRWLGNYIIKRKSTETDE